MTGVAVRTDEADDAVWAQFGVATREWFRAAFAAPTPA